jgi:hypothetical protein
VGDWTHTVDCPALIQWKTDLVDGADREGAHHAMHLQESTGRKRYLVISVCPEHVEIHGLYWTVESAKAIRVKLGAYKSLSSCLAVWLEAIIWFVSTSSTDSLTPNSPTFSVGSSTSRLIQNNVYIETIEGKGYVYKVYDYVNRGWILEKNRRLANFELVVKFYPPGTEVILSLPDLNVFRSLYVKREKVHLPSTKALFLSIGKLIQDLHFLGWIHGDIRLANMMFTEDEAYLIDFDFARKTVSNPTYIEGYFVDRLPRHPAALDGKPMRQCHDVHSYCKSGTGKRTGVCPFLTMELALEAIKRDGSELIDIDYVDIDELSVLGEQIT